MTIVNERGQITGDGGVRWFRDSQGLWSVEPRGYRIVPARFDRLKYELYYATDWNKYTRSIAHTYIFESHSVAECMRVAEIYVIHRRP
jgi:hypothetical protein